MRPTASGISGACSTSRSAVNLRKPARSLLRAKPARSRCARFAGRAAAAEAPPNVEELILKDGVADYYALLQVDDDASEEEIKAAYRSLAKVCHPDLGKSGSDGHNICILLNEAYEVLSDAHSRAAYNRQLELSLQAEADGYTGEALSKWMPEVNPKMAKNVDPDEQRAVFVDEQSCIGCMNCVWVASATFRMNHEYGRSRVFGQWLNNEDDLDTAILSCPVDCIHWVDRAELPALEFVCQQKQDRVDVSVMQSQQARGDDVFMATQMFLKERAKAEFRRNEAVAKAQASVSRPAAAQRRAAVDAFAKRTGWFGEFSARVGASVRGAAGGYRNVATASAAAGETARVGQRKRATKWSTAAARQAAARGGSVPRERALVLASHDDLP